MWLARNAIGTLRAVKIVHLCQSFQRIVPEHFEREDSKVSLKFEPDFPATPRRYLVHILQIGTPATENAGYFST